MANPESISYIKINDEEHPIDAVTLGGKSASDFQEGNLVTSINSSSTDEEYPSAKCIYDIVYGSNEGGTVTFNLSGSGTEEDPIVGWHAIAEYINPDGISDGRIEGHVNGVYNFFYSILNDEDYLYFKDNESIVTGYFLKEGTTIHKRGRDLFDNYYFFVNSKADDSSIIEIYPDDTITFDMVS